MREASSPKHPKTTALSWPLAVGVAVGFVLGLLTSPIVALDSDRSSLEEPMVEILVARRTIPAGTELGYEVLTSTMRPGRHVSSSVVRPEFVSQLVGEKVLVTILEGDPIHWSNLAAGAPESICDWVREANERRGGGN